MSCRDCVFLARPKPDKAGRVVFRKDGAYRCLCVPHLPVLPDSMTLAYDFKWPPSQKYMAAEDGKDCPCFRPK